MTTETGFRIAFIILLLLLIAMRIYFIVKVRLSGEKLLPDEQAVHREGGRVVVVLRGILFVGLLVLLVMFFLGVDWIDSLTFYIPAWLRWVSFGLGLFSVVFWTWTQIHLDTQWSAQLQLKEGHHLVTSGPYAYMRHPLYLAMVGWAISVSLITTNWIFVAICMLSIVGVMGRIPKEEQMMLEAFGQDYKTYMERVGRLFPKL